MGLVFHSLSFHYPGNEDILKDISLSLPDTGLIGLLGRSGSGKTTLLSLLEGTLVATEGSIESTFADAPVPVFQSSLLLSYLTAVDNVRLPCLLNGISEKESLERAEAALQRVGLTDVMDHYPGELSGGEKARVSLARALAINNPFLVLDEPTGQLDEESSGKVYAILKDISRDHLVLIVTHDEDGALTYCDSLYRLEDRTLKPVRTGKRASKSILKGSLPLKTAGHLGLLSGCRLTGKYLKRHPYRTLFSVAAIGFALLIFSLGLNLRHQIQPALSELFQDYYAYHTVTVSMQSCLDINEHLRLNHQESPTDRQLEKIGIVASHVSLDAFIEPETSVTVNNREQTVSFQPVLSFPKDGLRLGKEPQDKEEVIVNRTFLKEFGIDEERALDTHFSLKRDISVYVSRFPEREHLGLSYTFRIVGVSKEMTPFNAAGVYYSHPALLKDISARNLSTIFQAHPEIPTIGDILENEEYRQEDILSHHRLIEVSDPFVLQRKVLTVYGEDMVLESKVLAIHESTEEILTSLIKLGSLFLLLSAISATLLEFMALYSLYDENRRFLALVKVFSYGRGNTLRIAFLTGLVFSLLTSVFLLLGYGVSLCVLIPVLKQAGYPAFLSFLDFPALFSGLCLSGVLSLPLGFLSLQKVRPTRIQKELEGED